MGISPGKAANHVHADAGIFRRAGSGRNHNALRLLRGDLVERDLVVAMHFQLLAQLPEELREVVGKGIVVVEKQNHRLGTQHSILAAVRQAHTAASQ